MPLLVLLIRWSRVRVPTASPCNPLIFKGLCRFLQEPICLGCFQLQRITKNGPFPSRNSCGGGRGKLRHEWAAGRDRFPFDGASRAIWPSLSSARSSYWVPPAPASHLSALPSLCSIEMKIKPIFPCPASHVPETSQRGGSIVANRVLFQVRHASLHIGNQSFRQAAADAVPNDNPLDRVSSRSSAAGCRPALANLGTATARPNGTA